MHPTVFHTIGLLSALMLISPLPANSAELSEISLKGSEIEEPIGETVERTDGDYQCFNRQDWVTMGSLVLHYHAVYPLASLYLKKNYKQAERIENLSRHKTELLIAQNQTLITGDKLRLELDSEKRKKRIFTWFAGIGAGVSIVLGFVLYGVAKR